MKKGIKKTILRDSKYYSEFSMSKVFAVVLAVLALILFYTFGMYNRIQTVDEDVTAAWSEVVNQYQRRTDLIPNIVNSVKGYAAHEKEVLIDVVNARAKATSMQVSPEMLNNPVAFQQFTQAQSQLGSSLGRLLVTVEKYPDLKASSLFKDLQTQLEGTENRITVARNRYIKTVRDYNLMLRKFPGNILAGIMGYSVKPNFGVENEAAIAKPPVVDFNTAPAAK